MIMIKLYYTVEVLSDSLTKQIINGSIKHTFVRLGEVSFFGYIIPRSHGDVPFYVQHIENLMNVCICLTVIICVMTTVIVWVYSMVGMSVIRTIQNAEAEKKHAETSTDNNNDAVDDNDKDNNDKDNNVDIDDEADNVDNNNDEDAEAGKDDEYDKDDSGRRKSPLMLRNRVINP